MAFRLFFASTAALVCLISLATFAEAQFWIGRHATQQEISGWNIDVSPDGDGLPPGKGTVKQGQRIFADVCAACHARTNSDTDFLSLAGGQGSLSTLVPIKTVGSYWPYATTLFDYVRRAMPPTAPQSLTANQLYAVTAYILYLNRVIPEETALDSRTLPKVEMPNRFGFVACDERLKNLNKGCNVSCPE